MFANVRKMIMIGEKKAARIKISGVVQGVGFRWFAIRAAVKFGVYGYARNLYDGSVELLAEGDGSAVNGFIEEIKIGPSSAHVSGAEIESIEYTGRYREFRFEL